MKDTGMETKLKRAEEIFALKHSSIILISKEECLELIKLAQKDAVEKVLQIASEHADADWKPNGWLEDFCHGNNPIAGEDYEVYVINSSIIGLKEEIFKFNNL